MSDLISSIGPAGEAVVEQARKRGKKMYQHWMVRIRPNGRLARAWATHYFPAELSFKTVHCNNVYIEVSGETRMQAIAKARRIFRGLTLTERKCDECRGSGRVFRFKE